MADFDVQGKITFDATQAQTALKQTASSADQAATSTAKVGQAAQAAQPQIGQFGSALGLAGQAVGQLVPGLGQVISVAGSATGVIQGLTTAGLGPLGLAVAAVSVVVTAGVSLWKSYGQEQSNTADETRKLTRELYNAADAFDEIEQRRKKQQEQTARSRQLALGIAAPEQLDIERQRLAERLEVLELTNFSGENAREIQRIKDQQARLEENVAAAAAFPEAPATAAAAASERATRRGGRGGGRREERAYSYEGSGDARRDIERENRWIEKEEQESNARQLEDLNNFLSESADIANYYREREREEEERQQKELAEIQQKAEDDRLEAAKRTKELILETSMESLDTVLSSFDEAATANLEAMLTGGKMTAKATREMVKETMLALTTESIVQGLKQTALGLGALAMGSPSAALHFASAAKFAAVGVAAGVAGAAAGGFSGVGGDSGGGGAPAAATGGPALTPGASEGAGTTVVINWGSSGLVYAADRAQLGRDISGMISEAHGRLGRGM
jgi:hypothetical protein